MLGALLLRIKLENTISKGTFKDRDNLWRKKIALETSKQFYTWILWKQEKSTLQRNKV